MPDTNNSAHNSAHNSACAVIAVAQAVKEARKALEPTLRPLEGEIRGELSMLELAKLSTMMLTYNMDKALTTEGAAKNYIALQNTVLGAAQRATKLPDLRAKLPEAARAPMVKEVLQMLKADALLKVLGHDNPPAFAAPMGMNFED